MLIAVRTRTTSHPPVRTWDPEIEVGIDQP
jgi:hypothetical protein